MPPQSITNKLIANIKQATSNTAKNFIDSDNVICIDSSNNRIGINTKNPQHSIDISGIGVGIRADYILVNNGVDISDASCNFIRARKISTDIIDISFGEFKTLSGERIDVSQINVTHGGISTEFLYVPDLSCTNISGINLDFSGGIFSGNVNIIGRLTADNFNITGDKTFENVSIDNLIVNISGDISYADFNTISGNYIKAVDISCTNLDVSNNSNIRSLNVEDRADFNSIGVTGSANFNSIDSNSLKIQGTDINDTIGSAILNTLTSGVGVGGESIFHDVYVNNKLFVNGNEYNTSTIKNLKINDKLSFDELNGYFKIPYHDNTYTKELLYDFYYNTDEKSIYIYDEKPIKLSVEKKFITLELNNNVIGNEVSYNFGKWFIENPISLIETINNKKYKKIPLKISSSSTGNNFDISNTNSITQTEDSGTNLIDNNTTYEINANISVRILNNIPGDVEAANYTFGIYPYIPTNDNTAIDNHYAKIKNSIMVLDSSYNYSNSSLSYIGNLYRTELQLQNLDIEGISFYISSDTCLNLINIDSFNCTIKIV